MRFGGVTVLTNTPPRGAQSSPGGMQGITIMENMMTKAARRLGIDQVAIRRINAPEGKAQMGPALGQAHRRAYCTSSFIKQALDKGAEQFRWAERAAASPRKSGTRVRGVGCSVSCYSGGSIGFDGLLVIKTDGTICFQSGIGNLGTESMSDVHRVAAEMLGVPWEKCDICWGSSAKNLPWSCVSGGSQTIHAMTRAAWAVANEAKFRLAELAAKKFGGSAENYDVGGERVFRKGGGPAMTLAQAAQYAIEVGGIYDGHETPEGVNKMTRTSMKALAGTGFIAAARDTAPHDGQTLSFVASFAEVEVDLETGKYQIVDFLAVADVGTVIHPRALGGQVMGRSVLGIGHAIGQKWVYDQHYGMPVAKRFHHTKPPTILDLPPEGMNWTALDIPDPETPVGARGIGEPPVGGGCAVILNALTNALGEEVIRRAPITADLILASLELGKPAGEPLTAHV
jgi:CO/xanthine dehydrogenase Mo-binding subunit